MTETTQIPGRYEQGWVRGAEDARILVEKFGAPPEGEWIILVSGAGAPARFWPQDFCWALASQGVGVLRFDHRDTGLSSHLTEPYPISTLLDDLAKVVLALSPRRFHLIGHSMGGYLVQMAAAMSDFSPKSIVSISAGPTIDEGQFANLSMTSALPSTWDRLNKNKPSGRLQEDWPNWKASWNFLNGSRFFDEKLARNYTEALYRGDPRNAMVATNHIQAMATLPENLPSLLKTIQCPALIVHGRQDPLVPYDNGLASANLISNSSMLELQGAGHMFFDPNIWSELLTAITRFTTDPASSGHLACAVAPL